MMYVFEAFTARQISAAVPWSHLVLLSSVEDKKTREEYLKKAESYKLSLPDLKKELDEKNLLNGPSSFLLEAPEKALENESDAILRLKVKRGTLHTYRVKDVLSAALSQSGLEVDCGFYIYNIIHQKQKDDLKLKADDCVSASATDNGWKLTPLKTELKQVTFLYTYKATLHKAADADTLTVIVDLGFNLFTKQKLRLRNLNAPEINTEAGQKAKDFVLRKLRSVDFFVVKTYSTDLFDRYLVDVFYLPGEADAQKVADEGIYLNQELIDNGLADVWRKIEPGDLLKLN